MVHILSQVKTKGARRITFSQFADALALVAAKKGTPLAEVAGAVLAADGPSVSGTRADYVKFHDDKVAIAILHLLRVSWRACRMHADPALPVKPPLAMAMKGLML